jgi:hypothetical protein
MFDGSIRANLSVPSWPVDPGHPLLPLPDPDPDSVFRKEGRKASFVAIAAEADLEV